MIYTFLSPAKLNLFLYVIGKRKDGYHNLVSLFHTINFYDIFEVKENSFFEIKIYGRFYKDIPENEENLIYKVKNLFEKYINKRLNFSIKLYKNIPPFKGLGGGSSNAAIFLKFLKFYFQEKYNIKLEENILENILLKIGSDTLFFYKTPSALVEGRGEKITPLEPLNNDLFLYLPNIKVSTKEAYRAFKSYDFIPREKALDIYKTLKESFPSFHNKKLFYNSFENINIPSIKELKKITNNFGKFTLSGSGSAFFSIEDVDLKDVEKYKVKLVDYRFKVF